MVSELEPRLRLLAAAGSREGLGARAGREEWGRMIHPSPHFLPNWVPSPRSRGRENPSRSRVGCCCCCLSPALGACLAARVCASTHPTPLAQRNATRRMPLLLPLLAASEQAPPPGLPGGIWAFLRLPEAAGAPASLESRELVARHGYSTPFLRPR